MSKEDLIHRLEELNKETNGALKTIVDAEYVDVSKT